MTVEITKGIPLTKYRAYVAPLPAINPLLRIASLARVARSFSAGISVPCSGLFINIRRLLGHERAEQKNGGDLIPCNIRQDHGKPTSQQIHLHNVQILRRQ